MPFCAIASLEAQEKTVRPDELACPVTANLLPEQVRTGDSIKFIFSEGSILRRVSTRLVHPEGRDTSVSFKWVPGKDTRIPFIVNWGVQTGILVATGKGRTDCFFLSWEQTGIPENVPCGEFVLYIPAGVQVREVTFSSLPSEKPQEQCPMPELGKEIEAAFAICKQNPEDKDKASVLIRLLEKATPRYDCRRDYDSKPVPAWWLANHEGPWLWIHYLYDKVFENDNEALLVYEKFLATSDGAFAEVMSEQMWGLLHDRPLFILENWTGIENNRGWVLIARPWPSQGNKEISKMIEIYRDIAIKEPKYKSACDEIISILGK